MTPITLPDNFFTRNDWDSQDLDVLGNSTKLIQETAEATKVLAETVQAQGEAITAETEARKAADEANAAKTQAVQDNLDAEATRAKDAEAANAKAIADEAEAREAADTTLQNNVNTVQANVETVQANVEAEAARAQAQEKALGERLDTTDANLATETERRTNADTALGGRIDAEAKAREDADTALGSRIDATNEALTAETKAREAADTALSSRVTTLESNVIWRGKYTFASVPAGATQTYAFQLDIKYSSIEEIAPYVVTTSPLAYPYVVLVQTDALTVGVRNLSEEDLTDVTVYAQTAGKVGSE